MDTQFLSISLLMSFILVLPPILFLVISLILKYVFRVRNRILNAVIALVISLAVSSLTLWILPPGGDCGTPYFIFPWTECIDNPECDGLECDPATDVICALSPECDPATDILCVLTMRAGILLCTLTKLGQYLLTIIAALVMIVPPISHRFLYPKVEGVSRRRLLLMAILFIHAAVFLPGLLLSIHSISYLMYSGLDLNTVLAMASAIVLLMAILEISAVILVIVFLILYFTVHLILKHVFRTENKLLELLIPLLFVLWLWICYIVSWLTSSF
ncbi:MAG: hypothetical protein U9Q22_05240 [Candidatus Altiarchaeota archaeon]|nr:hypothetical protein [Candidatus Altiarchaeota archaeon]